MKDSGTQEKGKWRRLGNTRKVKWGKDDRLKLFGKCEKKERKNQRKGREAKKKKK